jgi:hypothetical protein
LQRAKDRSSFIDGNLPGGDPLAFEAVKGAFDGLSDHLLFRDFPHSLKKLRRFDVRNGRKRFGHTRGSLPILTEMGKKILKNLLRGSSRIDI